MRHNAWIAITLFTLLALAAGVWFTSRVRVSSVDIDARTYPVRGLDLSAHNGDIDFLRLAADSVDFVMLKATEGTTFSDNRFHNFYNQARDAGIRAIGAYHFFRFDTDGQMQALNLLSALRGKTLDLPVVIDVEEWTNPAHIATAEVVERLAAMVGYLEANGHNVMFYTNKDGYNRFIKDRFDGYPLWICSFTDPPLGADPDDRWTLWQYSHRGWARGVGSKVDLSTFNGSRSEWLDWQHTATF